MLRVEMAQARPGMEIAMPITHPKSPETVLLRSGFVLDSKTITRLRQLYAREVWIKYPGLDFVSEQICPQIIQSGRRLSAAIGRAFGEVVNQGQADLEYGPYRRAIGDLLSRLVDNPKAGMLVVDLASSQIPLSRSAGQGCFLSLVLGLKLETYLIVSRTRLGLVARDVSNLGMGGLLRDVGMLQLPAEERWRWRAHRDQTDPTWRSHVHAGYEMVRGEIEPSAAAAVLNHHQRFDGSGFPCRIDANGEEQPVGGTDVHIFARIIAVADTFDRLRFPPAAGPDQSEPEPVPVVQVLHTLLRSPASGWLDPIVRTALVHVAPPFPVGSIVRLNDGQRCAVVAVDPLNPCCPEVAVLGCERLNPARFEEPREQLDLRETEGLHIAEAEGVDVTPWLFMPESPGEFDVHRAQTALIARPIEQAAG